MPWRHVPDRSRPVSQAHVKKTLLPALLSLLALACFDPLYEDPGQVDALSWAVCCVSGEVDTCACDSELGCEVSFRACEAGRCTSSLSQSCDAPGIKTDSGVEIQDAGTQYDGGVSTDAGTPTDGGVSTDAGTDGGVQDGGVDGGVQDGGTDGGTPDAGPPPASYGPCCDPDTNTVTTCACPATGCGALPPFTPCANRRCVAWGEQCR
jgi:hypothetical protein